MGGLFWRSPLTAARRGFAVRTALTVGTRTKTLDSYHHYHGGVLHEFTAAHNAHGPREPRADFTQSSLVQNAWGHVGLSAAAPDSPLVNHAAIVDEALTGCGRDPDFSTPLVPATRVNHPLTSREGRPVDGPSRSGDIHISFGNTLLFPRPPA
jgi:hypothetical protein